MKFLKKPFPFVAILWLLFISCGNNPEEQLKHITGYWEIAEVEKDNETLKEYTINLLVDYIEINDKKGFRKKVAPRFDGSFEITEDRQNIDVKINDGEIILHYSTPYDNWTETVLVANESKLVLLNQDKKKYVYKRYKKMNLELWRNVTVNP